MKALYTLFLQDTGSYADATKLPASNSTPDDDVLLVGSKTAVLKKERLPPKKSQENDALNQLSLKTVCPLPYNVKFVI